MKLVLFILALVTFACPAFAAGKESAYDRVMRTNTLRVGYSIWPPYTIQDPNTGELSGMGVDIAELTASFLDVKLEWVQMTGYGTQVEALKQGMYDITINDGPYVFTTIKFVDFSDPYVYAPVFVYGRDDETRFKTLDDLNKPEVTFIGLDGDLSVDLVNRLYAKAKLDTLPATTDPGILMTNVAIKKGDVTILDPGSIHTFNKNNKPGLKNLSPKEAVAVYPIGFAVAKGEDKLLNMLNGAVAAMINTNTINPIIKKWLPEEGAFYPVDASYKVE